MVYQYALSLPLSSILQLKSGLGGLLLATICVSACGGSSGQSDPAPSVPDVPVNDPVFPEGSDADPLADSPQLTYTGIPDDACLSEFFRSTLSLFGRDYEEVYPQFYLGDDVISPLTHMTTETTAQDIEFSSYSCPAGGQLDILTTGDPSASEYNDSYSKDLFYNACEVAGSRYDGSVVRTWNWGAEELGGQEYSTRDVYAVEYSGQGYTETVNGTVHRSVLRFERNAVGNPDVIEHVVRTDLTLPETSVVVREEGYDPSEFWYGHGDYYRYRINDGERIEISLSGKFVMEGCYERNEAGEVIGHVHDAVYPEILVPLRIVEGENHVLEGVIDFDSYEGGEVLIFATDDPTIVRVQRRDRHGVVTKTDEPWDSLLP